MACGPGREPEGYDGSISEHIVACVVFFGGAYLVLTAIVNLVEMFQGCSGW